MMLVDCHTCPVRDVHCADCMVTALTVLTGPPQARSHADPRTAASGTDDHAGAMTAPLDRAERRAVSAFLGAGLVSPATAHTVRAELEPVEAGSHHRVRSAG